MCLSGSTSALKQTCECKNRCIEVVKLHFHQVFRWLAHLSRLTCESLSRFSPAYKSCPPSFFRHIDPVCWFCVWCALEDPVFSWVCPSVCLPPCFDHLQSWPCPHPVGLSATVVQQLKVDPLWSRAALHGPALPWCPIYANLVKMGFHLGDGGV